MDKIDLPERAGWRNEAEKLGFTFADMEGEPLWDETSAYRFTLREIEEDIEDPSTELHEMCREAVAQAVRDEAWLTRLGIPRPFGIWSPKAGTITSRSFMAAWIWPMTAPVRRNCWNTMPDTPDHALQYPPRSSGCGSNSSKRRARWAPRLTSSTASTRRWSNAGPRSASPARPCISPATRMTPRITPPSRPWPGPRARRIWARSSRRSRRSA